MGWDVSWVCLKGSLRTCTSTTYCLQSIYILPSTYYLLATSTDSQCFPPPRETASLRELQGKSQEEQSKATQEVRERPALTLVFRDFSGIFF